MKNKQLKQILLYGIVGAFTTLINYVFYYLLLKLNQHYLIANSIAWIAAIIFAFYMNKEYVFESKKEIKNEAIQFFYLRVLTLIIENISLFILINTLSLNTLFAKLAVSIITIIGNYGFCRFKIFKQKEEVSYE